MYAIIYRIKFKILIKTEQTASQIKILHFAVYAGMVSHP